MSQGLLASLVRYGKTGATEKAQLTTWRDEALAALAANKGAQTVSGTLNGVSFQSDSTRGMTVTEWYRLTDMAIYAIDNSLGTSSRSKARF